MSEVDFTISHHAVDQYRDRVLFCPDLDKGKEVLRSLASLKRGEAWVWSPDRVRAEVHSVPVVRDV